MTKNPVAENVEETRFGVFCADRFCGMPVYADKVESGPRIGVRITYRHVNSDPACLRRNRGPT